MNLTRAYTIFVRQFYLLKKSWHRIFGVFYWSTLDLILYGILTVYLNRIGGAKFNFITVLIGAVIFWNFLIRVQQGVTISFLEDVWTRNFINLFSSPLTIGEYIIGLVFTSIFNTVVSIAFMTFLAWLLFAYNIFQFGLMLIPFVAVIFIFGWALGIFTTAVTLRLGPSSEILAWSIPALIMPFVGVFYPVSILPQAVQSISRILPITYVFEGMRNIILTGSFDVGQLAVAFIGSAIYFVLAYWFLWRSYRYVLKKGLFVRFSTEG